MTTVEEAERLYNLALKDYTDQYEAMQEALTELSRLRKEAARAEARFEKAQYEARLTSLEKLERRAKLALKDPSIALKLIPFLMQETVPDLTTQEVLWVTHTGRLAEFEYHNAHFRISVDYSSLPETGGLSQFSPAHYLLSEDEALPEKRVVIRTNRLKIISWLLKLPDSDFYTSHVLIRYGRSGYTKYIDWEDLYIIWDKSKIITEEDKV